MFRAAPIAVFVALIVLFAMWPRVPLVLFASFLFVVGVHAIACAVAKRTKVPYRLAAVAVVMLALAGFGATGYFFAQPIAAQVGTLVHELPSTLDVLAQKARGLGLDAPTHLASQAVIERAPTIALGAVDVLTMMVVCFFVGLYAVVDPETYRRAALTLVPPRERAQAAEILDRIVHGLGRWLLSRGIAMLVVGVLSTVGLALLHVPLALALGLIAGLFTFVEYLGPIVSAAPALLLALTVDLRHALYVLGLYVAIHAVEGYGLTPWIVRKAVRLPPAFTLSMQFLLGTIFGVGGLVLATPISVVLVILVQELYVERLAAPKASAS
jgi:predicted PurR-regulated permease PerM